MRNLWRKLLADEAGLVLSSEVAVVGTVGVLSMVVGLNAVACAVTSELNDLASAFGSLDQTFNYQSISKVGHGRVVGSGYNDAQDMCDCQLISSAEVSGRSNGGGGAFSQGGGAFSRGGGGAQSFGRQNTFSDSAPATRERLIGERVIDEVPVEPAAAKAAAAECEVDDEIIEERIILRRVRADCDNVTKSVPKAKTPKAKADKSKSMSPAGTDPIETKPQPKNRG